MIPTFVVSPKKRVWKNRLMKQRRTKEAKTPYRAKRQSTASKRPAASVSLRWTEIENTKKPILLEREGRPVAVILPYADYQRLAQPREQAWHELDELLAHVHSRTGSFSLDEIAADITQARQEARERRHGSPNRR